jgi:outer membrane protein OmpA-like peptidoglycan-associated protein
MYAKGALRTGWGWLGLAVVGLSATLQAAEPFVRTVGQVQVAAVRAGGPIEVPYITWGGDVATFHANGGLTTRPGTLFQQQGLNLKLVAGDDFVGQVRNYLSGRSPFLRGTTAMLGMASEAVGRDPRTKPVVFLQMTWSLGDHMVGRESVQDLNALKGKKVALQRGGPHVGLLDEMLTSAKLTWTDITPVWVDDLTGDKGPAAAFRKDPSIHACMVITPDMLGLTGGLEQVGTGVEGLVKGAHVVNSTAYMNRSVADVYACRKDFYDANRPLVEKFTATYLKACEEVFDLRQVYLEKKSSPGYQALLKMTQDIYGKDVIPTLADADGLIADCTFVGHPGNVQFFTAKGNLVGFEAKEKAALDLATSQGYASVRSAFFGPDWDYDRLTQIGKLTKTARAEVGTGGTFEPIDIPTDANAIYSFEINFKPNDPEFKAEAYGPQFQQVVELAARFDNAVIVMVGHADPTATLRDLVRAGISKGILKSVQRGDKFEYYYNNRPLNLEATEQIVDLIEKGSFGGAAPDPRATMQAALNLSKARADAVRKAIIDYAKQREYILNDARLAPTGVGISKPHVPKPQNLAEAERNMRVEFKLMRVAGEATSADDFKF